MSHVIHNCYDVKCILRTNYCVSDLPAVLLDVQRLVDAAASDSLGQFEWVDSVLVHAMKHGHWLLLSHANFCR